MPTDTIKPPKTVKTVQGGSWVSEHKGIVAGIVVVGAVGVYMIAKMYSNKKSTTSTSTTTSTAIPQVIYPQSGTSSYYTGAQAYSALTQGITAQNAQLANSVNTVRTSLETYINAALAANNPATSSVGKTNQSAGLGIVPTKTGTMIWLGTVGSGTGAQVGGGAPVYFGNATNLSQGAANEYQAGAEIYTPVAYKGLVGPVGSSPNYKVL